MSMGNGSEVHRFKEYLLSITMFVFGVFSFIYVVNGGLSYFRDVLNLLSSLFMVLMGITLFLLKDKNKMRAVGLCALALGFNRITTSFPFILSAEDMVFLYGVVMATLGASLMYSGYVYLNGRSRNALIMRVASLAIIIMYSVPILLFHTYGVGFEYYLEANSLDFAMMIMYAVYALVLYDDEVACNTPTGRITRSTGSLIQNRMVSGTSFITRGDASRLYSIMDPDPDIDATCPVNREDYVVVHSSTSSSYMVLQKRTGDDSVYITFSEDVDGSCSGPDFDYDRIESDTGSLDDCNHVILYSKNGNSMRIMVKDQPEGYE